MIREGCESGERLRTKIGCDRERQSGIGVPAYIPNLQPFNGSDLIRLDDNFVCLVDSDAF